MYHGMKFEANGRCIEIPGQAAIPAGARVRSYPVVERDRFIWIWMGQPSLADESKILAFDWHSSKDWRMQPAYLHYQAHYQLIVDNLLDFSHLTFVHAETLGTQSIASTKAKLEPLDGGARVSRWYLNDEMQPNQKRIATFGNPVDRWQLYDWHAPAFLRMDAGVAPAGTGAPQGNRCRSTGKTDLGIYCDCSRPKTGNQRLQS